MYSKLKRVACFVLAVLVLCMCVLPSLAPPAEAFPGVATATMIAVEWILGLAGLTFASAGAAHIAAEGFYNSSPSVKSDVDSIAGSIGTSADRPGQFLTISSGLVPAIQRLCASVADFFAKDKTSVESAPNYYYSSALPNIKIHPLPDGINYAEYILIPFDQCDVYINYDDIYNPNGTSYTVFNESINNCNFVYSISAKSTAWSGVSSISLNNTTSNIGRTYDVNTSSGSRFSLMPNRQEVLGYSFYSFIKPSDGLTYLLPVFSSRYIDTNGVPVYQQGRTWVESMGLYCLDATPLEPITTSIPFNRFGTIEVQKLIDALTALVDTAQGGLTIPVDDVAGQVEDGAKEKEDDIPKPYVPDLPWLQDLLKKLGLTDAQVDEIVQEKTDVDNPAIDKEVDLNVPTMPDLRNKFPFCVPFDLIALVGALAAEPVPPKWVFPIDYPSFNFHYELVLDLTRFEVVAQVIRWSCLIGWIYLLIIQTRHLIKA